MRRPWCVSSLEETPSLAAEFLFLPEVLLLVTASGSLSNALFPHGIPHSTHFIVKKCGDTFMPTRFTGPILYPPPGSICLHRTVAWLGKDCYCASGESKALLGEGMSCRTHVPRASAGPQWVHLLPEQGFVCIEWVIVACQVFPSDQCLSSRT